MSDNLKNANITCDNNRRGIALLLVLFIVAIVSILSFGFALKADVELSCGRNVEFRMDMDYLGLTSLNYAKSLILNPQDVSTGADGYWEGGKALKIEPGNDYFDIKVVRSVVGDTPECTYDISCQAYRLEDNERVSETKLQGQLRLDPFIAYWAGADAVMHSNMTVYGDVYCGDDLWNYGKIYGDVFAHNYYGSQTGQTKDRSESNVSWPGIDSWRFEPDYYIDTESYDPVFLDQSSYSDVNWGPTASNPAGIFYRKGNLDLYGDVKINGTLIVTGGHLDFKDGNVEITSAKNYPAIVCEAELIFRNTSSVINGLVQSYRSKVYKEAGDITIYGGLFIENRGVEFENLYNGNMIVKGDPMKASIKLMSTIVNMMEWSPVGGAYYKSIKRDN